MTVPTRKEAVARPGRRGPADPVRALMHRHRELCEHAVDPLEIAAALEDCGVTDRTAARFRHRDVFSLAEELYARVPRVETGPCPVAAGHAPVPRSRGVRTALQLLPGAVCAAALAAFAATAPATPLARPAVEAAGVLLVALALRLALRTGPLRVREAGLPTLLVCWTTGQAVYGHWLLTELLGGGPHLPLHPRAAAASVLGLVCAVAPAAGCARWFAVRGRRGLAASRDLAELASRVRPLLLGATAAFLVAQVALLAAARAVLGGTGARDLAAAAALGTLLFLARLLAVHGFRGAAATGLATAAVLEALACASVLLARIPRLSPAGAPVETLIRHAGPAAVPALACTVAAAGLLAYGLRALTGAWAHSPAAATEADRP
ncbi:hypothetical protein [Streptomyces gilvosporeus]|uniref:Integral membrane protein n=1 Tax=Streptomyces gilvosporeus TaxID=553510 RepID=A0A1V0TWJ7_9ACTN|nr:hypothetical protein [Streptomyces gilvosporeus]ARF57291.1 hypothetical protein B1H19_26745 [Streptomyces gilvosporeus]